MEKNQDTQLGMDKLIRLMSNPFYAVQVADIFTEPHPSMVTEEEFIKIGVRLISDPDVGPEKYIRGLLENLKGDYITSNGITPDGFKERE